MRSVNATFSSPNRLVRRIWIFFFSFGMQLSLLGLLAKIMCSICSFQLNIWNATHRVACILNWFLNLGHGIGACSVLSTGWPGIAVLPGSAHPQGLKYTKERTLFHSFSFTFYFYCIADNSDRLSFKYLFKYEFCILWRQLFLWKNDFFFFFFFFFYGGGGGGVCCCGQ